MSETDTRSRPGPLDGVRVIDLTQFVLGPYATQTLGDLGADVIKIEEPSGDRQRRNGRTPSQPRAPEMGPVFVALNRNKRSVALDLKTDAGAAALRALIATADIFIHNMRVDTVARLGFAYDAVAALKPDIIYVEATGYGTGGPYAGRQAFDDLIQAASGACGLLPLVDGDTQLRPIPSLIADKTCGLFAAIAALAALRHRERTGEGQYVEVPMLESFTGFMLAEHLYGRTFEPPTGRFGHTTTLTPHRRPYATKDGFIVVLPASQEQSQAFLRLGGIGNPYESERFKAAASSEDRVALYYEFMRAAASSRTTAEWLDLCAEHRIPAMRANTPETVFDDPHLEAVRFFERRDLAGEGTYRAMRPALAFSKTPAAIRRDPPRIGQHTGEVLDELTGAAAQVTPARPAR